MASSNDILKQLNEEKDKYYSNHSKNSLFKKSQKLDCAKQIANSLDINKLIDRTIYAIPGTNKVYLDYPIFKMFGNSENYNLIIDHIIVTFRYIVTHYKSLEVYINLESFTISAAERYKEIVKMFCENCLNFNTDFAILLTKFYVLNPPNVMEMIVTIFKPIVDKGVVEKLVFVKKEESIELIKKLQYPN
jgi:hypothetical protein